MEVILFFMFVVGIVVIVTTMISISNIKFKVYGLQKEVHDLSVRLEASLRRNEFNENEVEDKSSEDDVTFTVDHHEESNNNGEEELPEVASIIEELEVEEMVRTVAMKQSSDLKPFKSINSEKVMINKEEAISRTATPLASENKITDNNKVIQSKAPKNNLLSIESIISKLGIFLVLIGVGYMYKLAYDNGYVTPTLIVVFGYILGIVVLTLGLRVRKKNREVLSQVLFGGGIAILYITTFAAYQGYGLIKGLLAFIILFAITFLAFFIALSANSVAMSIVALLGSLLTPFIVGLDVLGLYGTGLYILFIAIGSMAIYIFKRWRLLQLTSIVSINIVTLLLSSSGDFTSKETVEFSILLIAILAVFYGVEYMHYYLKRDNEKELYLTVAIISVLPVFTLFQALMVLDISNTSWAIIFAIITLIFFGLNYLLYKKREHSLVTDVLMGYIGLFAVIGIILYFGGEVRYLAILILSVIFIIIHSKSGYLLTRIIGLMIYLIGYSWALIDLIVNVINEEIDLITIIVRVAVMFLITFITWMQKDVIRKVLGGFAFQVYFLLAVMSMVLIWTEDMIDPGVMMLAIFGVMMVLFIWLNKKFELLSIHAVVIMSVFPLLLKILSSSYVIYDDQIIWIQVIAFIVYAIEMYVISLTLLKNNDRVLVFILKVIGYVMMASIALIEITVWSDHFGYGLVLLACLTLAMDYFEDKDDKLMEILTLIYKIGFITLFILYMISLSGNNDFNIIYFMFDLLMLVTVYYFVKDFIKDELVLFGMITLIYMLVIYQNLSMTDNGIVTLFWAGYSIVSLGYFLFKGKRKLVYVSLGVVVFVAAKFILIDLSTIEMFWKIVTSMVFGAALLVLSYFIQPLLDKYDNENILENKEVNKENQVNKTEE